MTHTPGPWLVSDVGSDGGYYAIPFIVGRGRVGPYTRKEDAFAKASELNAEDRVRDAAPDLLSACESMLRACGGSENWNGETHEALKLMEAAIAKARGE